MTHDRSSVLQLTRRQVIGFSAAGCLASASVLLAACSPTAATPTPASAATPAAAPKATAAPQAAAAPQATAAPQAAAAPQATAAPPATAAPAAASAASPAATGQIKRGGTLRVDVQNDFVTMWPAINTGPIPNCCFDWLVNWRKGANGTWGPEPSLAESWELSGKTATFKLRKGITFHDGSVLDAAVVKWNIDMMVKYPKSTAKVTLEAVDPANPAEVVDPQTVRVNLKYIDGSLLAALSNASSTSGIASQAAFKKLGADGIARQAVGTGPFEMVSWQPGNQLILKANKNYWQKGADGKPLPYLDQIIYKYIAQDTVRSLDLQSGNTDFTEAVAPADIAKVKSNPNLNFVTTDWYSNKFRLVFNSKQKPFGDNVKLRQALLYAINREAIAKALGFSIGIPSKYDLIKGELGYSAKLPYYWYDPTKAKQLVKDAGFPNGVSTKLTIISRELDTQQAQLLQQMLGDVGIHIQINAMERTAWVRTVRVTNDFTVATQMSFYPPDPDLELPLLWASNGPAVYSRAKIPAMDEALTAARASYDPAVRQTRYEAVQKIMFDTAWWGFLWHRPWNYVLSKRVKGFDPGWGIRREEVLWIE